MEFNHLESLINAIGDKFGDHVADEIMSTNSIRLLSHYAERLGVEADHLQDLIDDVNLYGW